MSKLIEEINSRYQGIIIVRQESGQLLYQGVADYSSNEAFLKAIAPLIATAEGDMFETVLEEGAFPGIRPQIEQTCFEYALDWWKTGE